jgi:predicted lipid-binding transport protein (Tim44 family)
MRQLTRDQPTAHAKTRAGRDDVAFASYLGTVAAALLGGLIFVITLDVEGETKAAATVALLLPCVALAAVAIYAIINPLGQTRSKSERD